MEQERRVTVVPYTPELLPAVIGFSRAYWQRPTSDAFYDWRYVQPAAFSRMFVAMNGDACVGTLFALRKTYRLNAQVVHCLEAYDWHALADMRRAGVGIRLMRALMRQPERLIAVGGTGDVHAALPLMGWQDLGVAQAYELLVGSELVAERLERKRKVPVALTRALLAPVASSLFGPRRARRPAGAEVRVLEQPPAGLAALYDGELGRDLAQVPDAELLAWMTRNRWGGTLRFLEFRLDGRLRGWALTRVHTGNHGLQGTIVELFAPNPDPELLRWMVSEAAVSLLEARPRRLVARAIDPMLQGALVATGFRHAGSDAPARTWPRFGDERPRTLHLTLLHSDAAMTPYRGES